MCRFVSGWRYLEVMTRNLIGHTQSANKEDFMRKLKKAVGIAPRWEKVKAQVEKSGGDRAVGVGAK
jgi:hypothetical protein